MSSDIARATEDISAAGFSVHQDARIGALVQDIINIKYNFYSEEGRSLFRGVLQNDLVSNVIKPLLREPTFIFCRVFGKTRSKHCIVNRKDDARMRIVTVFCWSSESKATFYSGSHLHHLGATEASNTLLGVSDHALQHDDIYMRSQDIDAGGLALVDARCAWQITNGICIMIGIACGDEATFWKPMPFPSTMQDDITKMMAGTIFAIRARFNRATKTPNHIITAAVEEEEAKTRPGADDRADNITGDQGALTPNLDN
ncbi:hypothetical protein RAB80_015278 [Fusarium oxysporum f. sp. vasinfectum]|nr:hypothetical protein RAB80_015278 [Fusarium oxysporum f. sp. vasinfectum]